MSEERAHRPGRGSSREAFLDTTGRLLRRQGYAASGLNEIVAASGAPRGSLYFHFPGGKEELALAAIKRSGQQLRRAMAAALASETSLADALGTLIDAMAGGLRSSGYRDGCPIATVALESATDSQALRDGALAAFDSWLEVLERRLGEAGMTETAARRRALMILSALEGALILSRVRQDVGPLQAVREEIVALSDNRDYR